MRIPRLKRFEDSVRYEYIVCEVEDCINEADKLTMTEVRFVDICKAHYNKYILEIDEEI